MNKLLITSHYTFQDAQVMERHDTGPHSLPSSLPFPPPAHAKEALELARMQKQTTQVKHYKEFKCVCVWGVKRKLKIIVQ